MLLLPIECVEGSFTGPVAFFEALFLDVDLRLALFSRSSVS